MFFFSFWFTDDRQPSKRPQNLFIHGICQAEVNSSAVGSTHTHTPHTPSFTENEKKTQWMIKPEKKRGFLWSKGPPSQPHTQRWWRTGGTNERVWIKPKQSSKQIEKKTDTETTEGFLRYIFFFSVVSLCLFFTRDIIKKFLLFFSNGTLFICSVFLYGSPVRYHLRFWGR